MRKLYASVLVAFIIISVFHSTMIVSVEADEGRADVYIICLIGVGGWCVNSPARVRDGAIRAISKIDSGQTGADNDNIPRVHPQSGNLPPFYSISYEVVTDWWTYKDIIENRQEAIVVNTHGEALPVPSGYTSEGWVDKIADAMLHRRISWVHTSGYPFYRFWLQDASSSQEWGVAGFKFLMAHIDKPNVECWSPNEVEKPEINDGVGNLFVGWTELSFHLHYVLDSRPLKCSDFNNLWVLRTHGGNPTPPQEGYFPCAVVAFAKANQRLDPTSEYGFGCYVHVGTFQTYDPGYYPNERDYWQGYLGCAMAVWSEIEAFSPIGVKGGNLTASPWCEYAMVVSPTITAYSKLGNDWIIRVSLSVYGVIKSLNDPSHRFPVDHVYVNIGRIPPGCTVQLDSSHSIAGNGSRLDLPLQGTFRNDYCSMLGQSIIYMLSVSGIPVVSQICTLLDGVMLFYDWMDLILAEQRRGVGSADTCVDFDYDPVQTATYKGSYFYCEFESIITVEMRVPGVNMQQWRIFPMQWEFGLYPFQGSPLFASGGLSIAGYFDVPVGGSYFGAVFSDNFEHGPSAYWSVGDLDSIAGLDYWGVTDHDVEQHDMWCAWNGNNSLFQNLQNRDPTVLCYDKNMNAYLRLQVNLGAYRSANLSFEVSTFISQGDTLHVERLDSGQSSWTSLWSQTNINQAWRYVSVPLANKTQYVQFRFVSNGDSSVNYGVSVDNVEILGEIPSDAGKGIEAGSTFEGRTPINAYTCAKNYAGYISSKEDWYGFNVSADTYTIQVVFTNPDYARFRLELRDSNNVTKQSGMVITYNRQPSDPIGRYGLRVFTVFGFGQYAFDISLSLQYGGCPYLSVYSGTEYVTEGLLDIHNPNGTDITVHHILSTAPARVGLTYRLRLTEHPLTHSYIDQVRLLALCEGGRTVILPLVSAVHARYGDVLWQLLLSDNIRIDISANETMDLKFAALPLDGVQSFTFVIEGYNPIGKE